MHFFPKSAMRAALLAVAVAVPAAVQIGQQPAGGAPPTLPASAGPDVAHGSAGMVVAAEPLAAEAGLAILRQGGNAVDAAVAVAFALAVTHPQAGNLGGGGFMLVRLADGRAAFIDYREVAPAAARADMYLDADGKTIPDASTLGWRAAGVPGTVAGLDLALRNYGTLSLNQVLEPAIRLAERGFPVGQRLADDLRDDAARLSRFPDSRRIFLRNGRTFRPGDHFRPRELARTLKHLARYGARSFYEGALAGQLVSEMRSHKGLITRDDLRKYQPVVRQPLAGRFRGYDILTAPPPSSGGIALLEMLAILDPLLPAEADPLAPGTIHLVTEAMRRAFADRARYLGDPDFACIPVEGLLARRHTELLRASIDPERASASAKLSPPEADGCPASVAAAPKESSETTHFTVIDRAGNVVSNTYTINDYFGNAVIVPGLGYLLNNEMDDFTVNPGAPNAYGLVQGAANRIEPRKRPLSSMMPTLVLREGQLVLALGAPGGPRIINSLVLVLLNRLAFGRPLPEAVALPRYHHQWLPDALFVEEGVFADTQLAALRARGHVVRPISEVSSDRPKSIGRVNAIEHDPATGQFTGVGDARGGNVARGF